MKEQLLGTKEYEKKSGFLKVAGCDLELPVTVIRGKAQEGKTALITAGVHSAEYVGIQAAVELARELIPEQVKGTVILAPLVNVSGFVHRTMSMVYEDGKNLNRLFPGAVEGTTGDRICHTVTEELLSRADYYIDLHSGDGYEELKAYAYYVGTAAKEVAEASFRMASCVETDYLVESQFTTGGAYNHASSLGIPSILLERGGLGVWSREEVDADKRDVRRILAHLGILEPGEEGCAPVKRQTVFHETVYESAPVTGLWYPVFHPGERFPGGALLGEIRDYFGDVIHECRARAAGMILYQTASLNVLKDGPMVAYGVLPE